MMNKATREAYEFSLHFAKTSTCSEIVQMTLDNLNGFARALYLSEIIDDEEYGKSIIEINQIKMDKGIILEYQFNHIDVRV